MTPDGARHAVDGRAAHDTTTVTDDEREVEATGERVIDRETVDAEVAGEEAAGTTQPSPDEAMDRFLELEAELAATDAATEPRDGRPVGLVVGAETVPADAVPDSYPTTVTTESALELRVVLRDSERTTVYLDWPEEGVDPESALGRLLAALDIPADDFAELYGETLLLERERGHYTVLLPPEPPRGSGRWVLGVAGGLAFNTAVLGLLGLAAAGVSVGGLLSALLVPFLVVNLLVLPWATYRDATYLRTHSDWSQGPPFWGALSMIPLANVGVSALYLWSRSRARFLGSEPSLSTKIVRTVRRFV